MTAENLHVLIVSDSSARRELLRGVLEKHSPSLEISEASSVEAAVIELGGGNFQAVILDYTAQEPPTGAAVAQIGHVAPYAALIVTSDRDEVVNAAVEAGATSGLVIAGDLAGQLLIALDGALRAAALRRSARWAEQRLSEMNSSLLAIRNASEFVTSERDPRRLLKQTFEALIEARGYHSAMIVLTADGHKARDVLHVNPPASFRQCGERLLRGDWPECLLDALQNPGAVIVIPAEGSCDECRPQPANEHEGAFATSLDERGRVYGVVCVSAPVELLSSPDEQELLRGLAANLTLAHHIVERETLRREAVESLRKSERKFRELVESAPLGIALFDHKEAFLYANPSLLQMLGYERVADLNTVELLDHVAPEYRDFIAERLSGRRRGETVSPDIEIEAVRKDGSRLTLHVLLASITLPDGLGAILYCVDITARKEAERRLLAQQDDLRALAAELGLAEERERRRVAAMLHDTVVQQLVSAKLTLGIARESKADLEREARLQEVSDLLQEGLSNSRSLMYELSTSALYEIGFEQAVRALCDRFEEQAGLKVSFSDDRQPCPLGTDLKIMLFLDVRQLLTTATTEAHATEASVSLARAGDDIEITVADNGAVRVADEGTEGQAPLTGRGLYSISERLRYFGGAVKVAPRPGGGSIVTLRAPLEMPSGETSQ